MLFTSGRRGCSTFLTDSREKITLKTHLLVPDTDNNVVVVDDDEDQFSEEVLFDGRTCFSRSSSPQSSE